jgi:hypothetical protein
MILMQLFKRDRNNKGQEEEETANRRWRRWVRQKE